MSDTTSERQIRHLQKNLHNKPWISSASKLLPTSKWWSAKNCYRTEVRSNHSYDYEERHSDGDHERFSRNEVAGSRFEALIHDAYEKIIQWKRNIFMLPTGASGKKYIDETTRLFNLWINNSPCNASFITSKTE